MDAYLQTGPELTALRETQFYTQLRPFIKKRASARGVSASSLVREEDGAKLTAQDCFFFELDFIFGDLFRNARSRRWIRAALQKMTAADRVDEIGGHFLYRAYLNELVVVMERLQRLIALLAKGLNVPAFVTRCETDVLQFFNPLLPEKRNTNHHSLYLSYPRSQDVESLLNRHKPADALRLFRELMGKEIEWFDYTEKAFATFLSGFLERVHVQLRRGDSYVEPSRLPVSFRLNSHLRDNIRYKRDHVEVFRSVRKMTTRS